MEEGSKQEGEARVWGLSEHGLTGARTGEKGEVPQFAYALALSLSTCLWFWECWLEVARDRGLQGPAPRS